MCGRYTLATPSPADLRARFPIGESVEIKPRYNVAPGDDVLVKGSLAMGMSAVVLGIRAEGEG